MLSLLPPALLFLATARATSFFPNTTTSGRSSSQSTTSIPSTTRHSLTSSSSSPSSTTYPWQKSCLYDPGLGYGNCNRPGDPVYGPVNNPYDTSMFPSNIIPPNPSLATYCNSMFSSRSRLWLSTALVTSTTYPGYTNSGQDDGALTTITSQEIEAYYNEFWTYTAAPPCCLNCTLFGGNVQVYYWPTPAPSPPVSTLVNDAGFTFISPSVYVAFQSLHATDLCGPVGPTYNSTTLAFAQDELMTGMAWDSDPDNNGLPWTPYIPDVFSTADWAEKKNCTNITSSWWQGDGTAVYPNFAAATSAVGTSMDAIEMLNWWVITYNPCSPTLSVPTQLFTINSLWRGCVQGIDAFYDPPYPLTSGGSLTPFKPTVEPKIGDPAQATKTTTTAKQEAAAGSTPTPTTPTSTQTSYSTSTTSSLVSNDPGSNTDTPLNTPVASPNNDPVNTGSANGDPPASTPTASPNNDPVNTGSANGDPPASTPAASPNNDPVNTGSANGDPPASTPASYDPSTGSNDPPAQGSASGSPAPAAIATIGGSTVTANSESAFVFGGKTLTPGGQATVAGVTYSLATNGAALVIGTSIAQILTPASVPSASEYILGTQMLQAGSPAITVSGTVISLQPGGQSVVVDGSTRALTAAFPTSISQYLVGSQTLMAGGPAITVSGTEISLAVGGSSVVVGGTTEALSVLLASATSQNQGIGGIIASLGGFVTPAPTLVSTSSFVEYNGTLFTGGSSRTGPDTPFFCLLLGTSMILVVLL